MIDKQHRFQGYGSLRFVYQRGQTVRGPLCSLKYIVNRRRTTYRVAVVVSRKVSKLAVVRNRIRRRMYEVIRDEAKTVTQPFDLVFIVYSDQLAELPIDQLHAAIHEKLEKANVFAKPASPNASRRAIVDTKEK